ncbi:uncharacterized protein LOC122660851 [Telopea speciosissima]|uniref:uncharacterized protein LOC122660851 n=1 Tax=Telopea speciosissima TaxID=54955 RepID=UPI001CC4EDA5|nr:uncharacterized protein LOC122660851 [Telopea speciosissima]
MAISIVSSKLNFSNVFPFLNSVKSHSLKPAHCMPLQQSQEQEDAGIMCEPCKGKGWLLCGFCNGQKTNVQAENNRIYRRCPSCRAVSGLFYCWNHTERIKQLRLMTFLFIEWTMEDVKETSPNFH